MKWLNKIIDKRLKITNEDKPARRISKGGSVVVQKNLDRISKDIQTWRTAQSDAEDFDYPDRLELMQIYKDVIDDAQVYSNIQIRINKSTSGTFGIFKEGKHDEELSNKFVDNKGFPLPWFRSFLISAEWTKFYGNELIQLGEIKSGIFIDTQRIPEENLIPQWEGFIFDCELGYTEDGSNFMRYDDKLVKNWLIPTGNKKDLGLLNKVTPYMIWKEVFGSWSMHADLFGQPLRIGKTDTTDPEMKQNMLDMLSQLNQGAYAAIDTEDIVELLQEQKGDPYKIYEALITACDQSISKIILGGTMVTDDGSSRSQSEVHERSMGSIIFADKIDLQTIVNEKLIPRMKILGILPDGDYAGAWNMDETLSIPEWSDVLQKLSSAGYKATKEEVEKKIGMEFEEMIEPEPIEPKKPNTEMNNVMDLYKDFI